YVSIHDGPSWPDHIINHASPWVRAGQLPDLFCSWDLAYRCIKSGWLRPIIQGKRRTIYRLADVLTCIHRIEAGELPGIRPTKRGRHPATNSLPRITNMPQRMTPKKERGANGLYWVVSLGRKYTGGGRQRRYFGSRKEATAFIAQSEQA